MSETKSNYGAQNISIHNGQMKRKRLQILYLKSAAVILLMAATLKAVSLFHHRPFLDEHDSIFSFLTNLQLVCVVIVFEGIVGGVILFSRRYMLHTKSYLLAWLTSLFCIYRFGLWVADDPRPCKCFGDLFNWIGLSDIITQRIVVGLLLYLFVPNFLWIAYEKSKINKDVKNVTLSEALSHE